MLWIALFLLTLSNEYISYDPSSKWYKAKNGDIEVYWEEKIKEHVPKIISYLRNAVEYIEAYTGRKVPKFSLVIFFAKDGTRVGFIYNPDKIFLVNFGGLRVDSGLYPQEIKHIIAGIVACSLFEDVPKFISIFPPDFFIPQEVMTSFCQYFSLTEDNFYSQGSVDSQVIKFLEKRYGKKFVFDLFLDRRISLRKFSEYKKEYLSWKAKNALEVEDPAEPVFMGSRGIAYVGGDLLTISGDSIINLSDGRELFRVKGSNWINGNGEFAVFDSEGEDGFFNVYIIAGKTVKRAYIPARAWYPTIWSGGDEAKIAFVKKSEAYDELCEADLPQTELTKEGDLISITSFNCFLRSGELEEFLTPNFSPDGKRIAFSIKRKNDFIDLGFYDIGSKKLLYITQDRYIDVFPSWRDNDNILFSSNRLGTFSLFVYKLSIGEIYFVAKVADGILETLSINDKIYAVSVSGGSTFISKIQYGEKQNISLSREPVFTEMFEIDSKEVGFSVNRFGILPFYFFISNAGFVNLALNFYVSDRLFRNPFYFKINYRTPFSIYSESFENLRKKLWGEVDTITGVDSAGGMLGFSTLSLFRLTDPYIYAKLEYVPFSEIFVRRLQEDGTSSFVFFHERQFNISLFGVYTFTNLWVILGGRFTDVDSEINKIEGGSAFWDMVRAQYKSFGFGNFLSPEVGVFLRTAKKSFFLSSGVDAKAFGGVNIPLHRYRGVSPYFDFSASYFSPELYRLILELNLNGFFKFQALERFKGKFGSLPIPFYYDPAPKLDPLLRFEHIPFNLDDLRWDIGLIRGVRLRSGGVALIPTLKAHINLLNLAYSSILSVERVNLAPYISYAIFSSESPADLFRGRRFSSFGAEFDVETTVLFTMPLTFKLGVARGEETEIYFSIFISVGSYRSRK